MTVPSTGRHDAVACTVNVALTIGQCRVLLAALADVTRRERGRGCVMLTWGGAALGDAAADKRKFACQCDEVAGRVRAAAASAVNEGG